MPSITPNRASEEATQLSLDTNKQVRSLRKMWLRVARKTVGGRVRRKLVCFALAFSLLILPGPGLPLNELPALASRAADATAASVSYLPLVLRNLFGIFFSANPRPQNLAERIASVRELRISPHKLVGYVGDRVSFAGMGIDGDGQPAHGAKFEWESSDASKLEIDEAGGATLLRPGLVRVTWLRCWISLRRRSRWDSRPGSCLAHELSREQTIVDFANCDLSPDYRH